MALAPCFTLAWRKKKLQRVAGCANPHGAGEEAGLQPALPRAWHMHVGAAGGLAIHAHPHPLHGALPCSSQSLLPRCPAAEKAAKQARKERLLHKQATGMGLLVGNNSLLAAQLQQQLLGLVSRLGTVCACACACVFGGRVRTPPCEARVCLPSQLAPMQLEAARHVC